MIALARLNWLNTWWQTMRMDEPDTLLMWRDWFSRAMLTYGAIVFPLSMIYNLPIFIAEGKYGLIAADTAFWLLMICLLFVFRFPSNVRGYLSLGALYAMTVTFLVSLGPSHARPAWLVMCTVFAGVLLGVRGAIAAALFNSTVLMALYALMGPENKAWASVYTGSLGSWIMFTFNSSFLALASGLTVGFLLNRLDRSLRYQRNATDTLLKRSKELEKANELLQREMEQRSTAEKTLIQSEMKYRLLAENATDIIWTVDMDLNITYVSPSVYRVLGNTPKEIMATKLTELLTADSVAIATRVLTEELAVEAQEDRDLKRSRTLELEFLHKDGSTYWSEVNLTFVRDHDGKAVGILGVSRDISDRKRAEEALRESEARYRIALEASPDPIVTYDTVGRATYINPAFTKVFGWEASEVLGMKIDFVPEAEWPKIKEMIDKVLTRESFTGVDTRRYTRSGKIVDVSLSAGVFRDHKGALQGKVVVLRDITEQKKLESHLRQAQKMEAIGTLAGGIAHDFNNILGVIMGYTELAAKDVPGRSRAHGNLQQVLKASHRAKDLVQQILTFSRQADQERKPMYLGPVIKEALKLMRASLPSSIQIQQKIEPDNWPVQADPTQIHQVMINLCTNAAHAMSDSGGVLDVGLASVELDRGLVGHHSHLSPGRYLKLAVSDTGHGIGSELLDRIFEPYFTTKEKGEGTGLGLAVVEGIVKSHGGAILVDSTPGKGSQFQVFLPALKRASDREQETTERDPTGVEHVLFLDDEPTLVEIGKQMLEQLGYQVTARTSSVEALDLFRAQPGQFDLVITDMTMPQMTGDRLAQELMSIRKDLPVILCTGFSHAITGERAARLGIKAFLMKPLVRRDLARTVREVLDRRSKSR